MYIEHFWYRKVIYKSQYMEVMINAPEGPNGTRMLELCTLTLTTIETHTLHLYRCSRESCGTARLCCLLVDNRRYLVYLRVYLE